MMHTPAHKQMYPDGAARTATKLSDIIDRVQRDERYQLNPNQDSWTFLYALAELMTEYPVAVRNRVREIAYRLEDLSR